MGSQEHFPLCWSSHQAEVLATFQQHLSEETLVDVTLVCEGISLKAHKMILSACSPYFQNLFLENPCKHPIVIIKDADYRVLKGIVDFMYHGGINVSPDQLSEFLKTAESLKVKGLSDIRKSVELNSEAYAASQQNPQKVVNNAQSVTSEHADNVTQSPAMCTRQRQSNEDSENEEHFMAEESNSFSIVEVKSEPESNEDISICYEQTVLPDYPSSDINNSSAQYTVSVPHSTDAETSYNHSVVNEQCVEVPSGCQQDIVMKETPPQFSDMPNQNTSFNLMQGTSEDAMTTHLSSDQYNSCNTSVSQYIAVHDNIPAASKNQDSKSNSLVPFEESMFHSSNQMCENYSSRNPIIDGIAGILEQKSCILDKTIGSNHPYSSSSRSNGTRNSHFAVQQSTESENGVQSDYVSLKTVLQQTNENLYNTSSTSYRNQNGNNISQRQSNRRNLSCNICVKMFTTYRGLLRHARVHSGERPFSCEICGKSFSRKDYLQQHLAIHSGYRPHSCDICHRTFITKSSLRTHLKSHSNIAFPSQLSASEVW